MDALKAVFKFMIASTLIVSGVLLGGTLFATKKIDIFGDKLQNEIYGSKSNLKIWNLTKCLFSTLY